MSPIARCGCASDQCACFVVGGPNIDVSGTGSKNNPYQIAVDPTGLPGGGGGGGSWLLGQIIEYGGDSAPDSNWLVCDGSAVSRAGYPGLFTVLSTRYGAGDGTTTFNLPDFRDRSPMGASATNAVGAQVGADGATLGAGNLPSHTHPAGSLGTGSTGAHTHDIDYTTASGGGATVVRGQVTVGGQSLSSAEHGAGTHTHSVTGATGAAGASSPDPVPTRTPSVAVTMLIRAMP